MASKTKTLGQAYELIIGSGVPAFLIQTRSSKGVRICAVEAAAPIPDAATEAYFVITNKPGAANAIGREGIESQDVYARSDSEVDSATITYSP